MAEKQRFPWVAVSAVIAVMTVTAVTWLELPEDAVEAEGRAGLPSLGLTQIAPDLSTELLAEKLAAYDPAPLFIPSRMNSGAGMIPDDARVGVGGPFAVIPPELTKTGPLVFPSPVPVPQTPVEGLKLTERTEAPLVIARADSLLPPLKSRLCQVQAVAADNGRVVMELDVPPSADLPPGDWQPLELMGAVSRAGLIGDLVVTSSSGLDEIDEYFRSHLKKNVRIGERLAEGFYTFRVGP